VIVIVAVSTVHWFATPNPNPQQTSVVIRGPTTVHLTCLLRVTCYYSQYLLQTILDTYAATVYLSSSVA
jgi:cytochrome c oxidase assembly factor CtaG